MRDQAAEVGHGRICFRRRAGLAQSPGLHRWPAEVRPHPPPAAGLHAGDPGRHLDRAPSAHPAGPRDPGRRAVDFRPLPWSVSRTARCSERRATRGGPGEGRQRDPEPERGDRVTVDVIRRDRLHAGLVLPSPWSALLPRSSPAASFPTDRRTRPPLPLRGSRHDRAPPSPARDSTSAPADPVSAGIPGIGSDTWTAHEPAASPLSMFDPVYLGCDLYGSPVMMTLAYRNLLPGEVGCPRGARQRSP
jgi:hypothetical protein